MSYPLYFDQDGRPYFIAKDEVIYVQECSYVVVEHDGITEYKKK